MDRQKVIELARDAGLFSTEVHVLMPKLERFAALIEAEMCKHQADKFCETHCSWTDHHVDCDQVRGDAEPVAWLVRNGVVDYQLVKRKEQAEHLVVELQKRHNLSGSLASFNAVPLYTHPAPAVVRQLVDGLAGLIDFIEIDNLKIDQDALRIARASLATAKEAGL